MWIYFISILIFTSYLSYSNEFIWIFSYEKWNTTFSLLTSKRKLTFCFSLLENILILFAYILWHSFLYANKRTCYRFFLSFWIYCVVWFIVSLQVKISLLSTAAWYDIFTKLSVDTQMLNCRIFYSPSRMTFEQEFTV